MALKSDNGRPESNISVLLVEDDPPTRQRLHDVLSAAGFDVSSVASLSEARAALDSTDRAGPDVLLTDLQLPDGHGTALIREVRQRCPDTEIMVISIFGDEQSVLSAITVGATGYLLKDAFPADIAAAVRDLLAGHSPISSSIARYIVRQTQGQTQEQTKAAQQLPLNTARLTPRETDILWGIAKGFSYTDIAGRLGLSRHTVPSHIKNIYRKLEVNSRSEAVFEAVQQGLIRL
jgi:DNA-binding NarL/FixJ family response regulator